MRKVLQSDGAPAPAVGGAPQRAGDDGGEDGQGRVFYIVSDDLKQVRADIGNCKVSESWGMARGRGGSGH